MTKIKSYLLTYLLAYLLTYSHIQKNVYVLGMRKIVSLSIKKRTNVSVPFGFRTRLKKPPTIRSFRQFLISVLGREGMKFKKIN